MCPHCIAILICWEKQSFSSMMHACSWLFLPPPHFLPLFLRILWWGLSYEWPYYFSLTFFFLLMENSKHTQKGNDGYNNSHVLVIEPQ